MAPFGGHTYRFPRFCVWAIRSHKKGHANDTEANSCRSDDVWSGRGRGRSTNNNAGRRNARFAGNARATRDTCGSFNRSFRHTSNTSDCG